MYCLNYIKVIFIFSVFFVAYSVNSQNHCDLDSLISIGIAIGEENDSLPSLDPPPPYESFSRDGHEFRMLYFFHGLNGDEESWSDVDGACTDGVSTPHFQFPARRVITQRPEYSSNQDLVPARNSLNSSLLIDVGLPSNYNNYNGIAIAHSQGGIVGRSIDEFLSRRYDSELLNAPQRKFGGLVTVSTPNQGAQIINNEDIIRGLVYDLADNLTIGPITEYTSSPIFFVRLMARLLNLNEMRDLLVNFIGNEVGSFLIAENLPDITREYSVPNVPGGTSSKIPLLNGYVPVVLEVNDNERKTDLVAFYAVADLIKTYHDVPIEEIVGFESGDHISQPIRETTVIDEIIVPISWATIHFQLYSPNTNIDPFEADNEDYLTAYRAHKTKNLYDTKSFEAEFERKYWLKEQAGAGWALNFYQYFYARNQKNKAEERRDAWDKGSVFLSKFDEFYRIMIGARYQEIVTTTVSISYCICDIIAIEMGFPLVFICDDFEGDYDLSTLDCQEKVVNKEVKEMTWRNKDSDGVVLVESQRDIPQHTHDPVPLLNVTHMQVRNSSHTADMLQTVFEGGVGNFFYTEVK